ncbi:MAG: copper resistance protein, partial [Pseudomonadota bacterium]|nr:copper resistance protein [Pseudomonadota bacterium]
MQFRSLLAGSAMLALLAGCAAGPTDQREDAGMTASQANYQGTLPCRNCDGIDLDVT